MAPRRRRFARFLALLALLILVFLLLELNRFLPGLWPGGGGDAGLRARDQGRTTDPTRVEPPPPSKTPPPEPTPPPGRVSIVLRAPDGAELLEGKVVGGGWTVGGPGATLIEGRKEWGVSLPGGRTVEHGQPPANATKEWAVQWPRAEPPPAAPRRAREVVVTDDDGKPIGGAHVEVTFTGKEQSLRTSADGKALLPRDSRTYRVCVTADGFGDACQYAAEDQPGPIEVRLPRILMLETRFVDPTTHEALVADAVRILHADGTATALPSREKGFDGFHGRSPADQAASESLEIEVKGRPTLRVPLAGLPAETGVPKGKPVIVGVKDAAGRPVEGAVVEATFAPPGDLEAQRGESIRQRARTDASGSATLPLPTDRSADVRVESADSAAAGFRVESGDAAPKEIRLEAGVRVPVRVVGPDGKPVQGATVIALGKAGDLAVRSTGTTDKSGLAFLPPIPAGVVEVYAHARGFAWGTVRAIAGAGMATVEVSVPPADRLLLVVEDPYGVPIPGVRVRRVPLGANPAADPAPRAAEAASPDAAAWATDDNGVLDREDVDSRPADLWLSKPGWQVEVIHGVIPGRATWFATLVRDK